ncbi:MAG TPA: polysaccharide pyruvyl transferase family protein [Phenylobacterium sp.]|nr:polysaccharide pyruvyl transferase family protein [Phenylobacterium sp.]
MNSATALRPIKIGLLWHSASSANLGVGALTIANLAIARKAAADLGLDPRFHIIGMRDGNKTYVSPDEAEIFVVDTTSLFNPSGCWKVIGAQDCVVDIGAGDSFADIYGIKRFMFLWLTKMMAIVRGTPLLLAPQTIGPFTRFPYRQLARFVMERARAVVPRDRVSLDFLNELAPKAHGVLSVDVAFALPYEDHSALRNGLKVRVGVNVSGLLFNLAEQGKNQFGLDADYAVLMRRFIGDLVKRPDTEVHLIVHVPSSIVGTDEDASLADRLAQEFPGVVRGPNFPGPSEAKSYISGLDFLVAGRMHACIAAFSAGVAVVPIAYSRKFSGLFEMLDYPWMVPVKGMDADRAYDFLMDCLERREELARAASDGMTKVEALQDAYRAELRTLFAEATAR